MKFIDGVLFDTMGNDHILVVPDSTDSRFHGIMKLNQSAHFIAEMLTRDTSEEDMLRDFLGQYPIDEDYAKSEIKKVTEQFKKLGIIICDTTQDN